MAQGVLDEPLIDRRNLCESCVYDRHLLAYLASKARGMRSSPGAALAPHMAAEVLAPHQRNGAGAHVLSCAPIAAKDVAALLHGLPVFAGIPRREIDALAALATQQTLRPREYAFMEGDVAGWIPLSDHLAACEWWCRRKTPIR